MTIENDMQLTTNFATPEHEAHVRIIRAGSLLVDAFEQMLKPHGITATQFNVLRILRGAGTDGLCRNEIRDRMVSRMPDVTRLLDRMEDAGFIARQRSEEDRRMVRTRITKKGHALLDRVDSDVERSQKAPFSGLTQDELTTLVDLVATVEETLRRPLHDDPNAFVQPNN